MTKYRSLMAMVKEEAGREYDPLWGEDGLPRCSVQDASRPGNFCRFGGKCAFVTHETPTFCELTLRLMVGALESNFE